MESPSWRFHHRPDTGQWPSFLARQTSCWHPRHLGQLVWGFGAPIHCGAAFKTPPRGPTLPKMCAIKPSTSKNKGQNGFISHIPTAPSQDLPTLSIRQPSFPQRHLVRARRRIQIPIVHTFPRTTVLVPTVFADLPLIHVKRTHWTLHAPTPQTASRPGRQLCPQNYPLFSPPHSHLYGIQTKEPRPPRTRFPISNNRPTALTAAQHPVELAAYARKA